MPISFGAILLTFVVFSLLIYFLDRVDHQGPRGTYTENTQEGYRIELWTTNAVDIQFYSNLLMQIRVIIDNKIYDTSDINEVFSTFLYFIKLSSS